MADNGQQRLTQDVFSYADHAGVGQDKNAQERIYKASGKPRIPHSSAQMCEVPKKHGSNKRKTVEIGVCISPELKDELDRIRSQGGKRREKLSMSRVAGAFIEKGVQGHIDMQYGALLKPVIETAVKKEIASFSNRSANLALNACYSAEQARILCITILSMLLGNQTDVLPGLVSESQKKAHENMRRHLKEEERGD